MATHKGACPFPPREIGRFGRGLAWRAALIGPGLEPAFDDRQQTLKRVGHALLLKPGDLMAHLDLEGWGIWLAPSHRRLRDPAIASWMADTATTALPRSRRRTVVADNPLGSSPTRRKEVLHHRGRSHLAALGQRLPALRVRSLGRALATAGGPRGHDHRPLRG